MPTIAEKLFDFALDGVAEHLAALRTMPEAKIKAIAGRKGKVIISGPEGGTFLVRLTTEGVFRETEEDDIRNIIEMSDDTLLELLIYLARLPEDPGMSPRQAYVNGFITIYGDSVLYDAEEIFKSLEEFAFNKLGPIAREAVKGLIHV